MTCCNSTESVRPFRTRRCQQQPVTSTESARATLHSRATKPTMAGSPISLSLFRGRRAKLIFAVLVGSFPDCVECVRRSMAPEAYIGHCIGQSTAPLSSDIERDHLDLVLVTSPRKGTPELQGPPARVKISTKGHGSRMCRLCQEELRAWSPGA